jgi:hypothetical protein
MESLNQILLIGNFVNNLFDQGKIDLILKLFFGKNKNCNKKFITYEYL